MQLAVITGLWETPEGETFSFDGSHYQLRDSPALPKPAQQPRPFRRLAMTADCAGGHGAGCRDHDHVFHPHRFDHQIGMGCRRCRQGKIDLRQTETFGPLFIRRRRTETP